MLGEGAGGRFRADLYFRPNGMTLTLPPLRERVEDLPLLAELLARRAAPGSTPVFSAAALWALKAHAWPGNIRELRTVVERAVMLAKGGVIGTRHLVLDQAPPHLDIGRPVPDLLEGRGREVADFDAASPPRCESAANGSPGGAASRNLPPRSAFSPSGRAPAVQAPSRTNGRPSHSSAKALAFRVDAPRLPPPAPGP